MDTDSLKKWFDETKRDLPWRVTPSPYAVWISEVMLQQTQVAVVVPYFERWMERFPTLHALAEAQVDEVVKLWEGLGYYSRARNLHAGAQQVVRDFGGELPNCPHKLGSIKGLGPYTVGAIRSFAFREKAAAVDGNVLRVLSRFYRIHEEIDRPRTQKQIWKHAEELLPDAEPWVVNEALIELGATICQRTPKCHLCPLVSGCQAFQSGEQGELPKKRPRKPPTVLHRDVIILRSGGHYLLKKGEKGKVMQDLFEFPYFEREQEDWKEILGSNHTLIETLGSVSHGFTRYRAHLYPQIFEASDCVCIEGYQWISWEQVLQLPFSSGHRRILRQLRSTYQPVS